MILQAQNFYGGLGMTLMHPFEIDYLERYSISCIFFSTEAKRKGIYFFFQPIGSSTWVITFCCSFHFIWRKILSEDQISNGTNLSIMQALSKLLISAAFSTPLMMVQMAFFQLISGDPQGLPTARTMLACIAVYLILIRFWPL